MNQPIPEEDNCSHNGINQQAENSTVCGGMQGIQGDNNTQQQNNINQEILKNAEAGRDINVGNITTIVQLPEQGMDKVKSPRYIPYKGVNNFVGR